MNMVLTEDALLDLEAFEKTAGTVASRELRAALTRMRAKTSLDVMRAIRSLKKSSVTVPPVPKPGYPTKKCNC
jgi:hypothetical protein